jgi:hypothetical protein
VEVRGIQHVFYADLVEMDPAPGVELNQSVAALFSQALAA